MFLYFYNSVGIFKSAAFERIATAGSVNLMLVFFSSSKTTKHILPMRYCMGIATFRGYSKRNNSLRAFIMIRALCRKVKQGLFTTYGLESKVR